MNFLLTVYEPNTLMETDNACYLGKVVPVLN
jgi:hypothetical protein